MNRNNEKTTVKKVRKETIPGYTLLYALYRTDRADGNGTSFSVSVSIRGEIGCETATAADLTRSRAEAERLFDLLADQTVTPCALADVLEEIL